MRNAAWRFMRLSTSVGSPSAGAGGTGFARSGENDASEEIPNLSRRLSMRFVECPEELSLILVMAFLVFGGYQLSVAEVKA